MFGIIICSMAFGALATRVNYRMLPSTPISIRPQQDNNGTTRINGVEMTTLVTKEVVMKPFMQFGDVLTEFKQGDIIGVYLSYSFSWNKNFIKYESGGLGNDTYIYIDGNLSAYFVTTVTIYDPNGKLVADNNNIYQCGGGGTSAGSSQAEGRRYIVEVPFTWEPGKYTIEAHVEELFTGFKDSKDTVLTILLGSPTEVKHPWPVAAEPQNFVLKLNDLPGEGWTQGDEISYSTTFSDCTARYESYFDKTVGNLRIGWVCIHIEQYENPEKANETFSNDLEMRIESEKAGDPRKVIMEEVGDKGYLHDNPERRSIESSFWKRLLETTPWVDGAEGSHVIFIKENIVVTVACDYRTEALSQGLYITNDELIQLAKIQAAKIVP